MPLTARDLIESRSTPITVKLHDLVQEAIGLMFENDFTTLPIVDNDNHLIGVVTANGILRAVKFLKPQLGSLKIESVKEKAPKLSYDADISEILPLLNDHASVVIVDEDDRVAGIVTAWDTSEYFRKHAEDMITVEDIENYLIDHINAAFTDVQTGKLQRETLDAAIVEVSTAYTTTVVKKAINVYIACLPDQAKLNSNALEQTCASFKPKPDDIKELDDLTLNELIGLLFHASVWKDYQSTFTIEKSQLKEMLETVRDTRNVLAHFKSEITREQRDLLRFCSDWLQNKNPARAVVTPAVVESVIMIPDIPLVTEEISPEESRYARLALYLQKQPIEKDRLRLTFSEVEKIIENDLPASARLHRSWWANDTVSHVQSQQWLEADWRVGAINMTDGLVTFVRAKRREKLYIDFFSTLLNELRATVKFPVRNVFPVGANWHTLGGFKADNNIQVAALSFSFARSRRFRVELYIDSGDEELNKIIFDGLYKHKAVIEEHLGGVGWERLNDKRASRVAVYAFASIMDGPEELQALQQWAIQAMQAMYDVISPMLKDRGYVFRG